MNDLTTTIENNKNLIQSANSTIVSMNLTKAGHKVGGILVAPAVWALNYTTQGSTPDKIDLSLYGMGFMGAVASSAAIGVSILKAVVDDDIDIKLRTVRASEDTRYQPLIQPCYRYGVMAPQINAATIASKGGTAWKHPNGLWVYITDRRGFLVSDFIPKQAATVYRPKTPMKVGKNGRLLWEMTNE